MDAAYIDENIPNTAELTAKTIDSLSNNIHPVDSNVDDLTIPESEIISDEARERESEISYFNQVNFKEEFIIEVNPHYYEEDHDGEEEEILPPPLTLDDPSPPRRRKRKRGGRKQNSEEEINDVYQSSYSKPSSHTSSRFQRTCKTKVIKYSDFGEDMSSSIDVSPHVDEENVYSSPTIMEAELLFPCDLCGAPFNTAKGVRQHKRWKHSKKSENITLLKSSLNAELKIKSECGDTLEKGVKSNAVSSALIKEQIQSETKIKNANEEKLHPCPICGRKFNLRGNLTRHTRIHLGGSKRYECPECGKMISSKQGLLGHIRFIHTGERPFKCGICQAGFASNSDLSRHQSKHSDVKKHKCPDCGLCFKQRSGLKAHMSRKTKEKLWRCGVCDRRFLTKHYLKVHMISHTKIKKYECETCQRQFSFKNCLASHMRVHTGEMPYSCSFCGKKFAHLSNKNRHARNCQG